MIPGFRITIPDLNPDEASAIRDAMCARQPITISVGGFSRELKMESVTTSRDIQCVEMVLEGWVGARK